MENKFKEFIDCELTTIKKSEAIRKLSQEFNLDKLEAEEIYNDWF